MGFQQLLTRYWFVVWLSGLSLPYLCFFVIGITERLGFFIPAGSPWQFLSLLLSGFTVMMLGIFSSERSVEAKFGLVFLTICLFPCCIFLFAFLIAPK